MYRCIITVPCFNEARRLDIAQFRRVTEQQQPEKILFVNDGSTDGTKEVLAGLRESNPDRFEVYDLERNMGKAEAVRAGILRALSAQPDYVGFWDADLSTPLNVVADFCALLEENPRLMMVFGARVKLLGKTIERRRFRHYTGRIFATAVSVVLKLPIYDSQCGAKVFRVNNEINALFQQPFRTSWVFDVELLARFIRVRRHSDLPQVHESIYELPLPEWRDFGGSKLKWTDYFRAMRDLIRVYRFMTED